MMAEKPDPDANKHFTAKYTNLLKLIRLLQHSGREALLRKLREHKIPVDDPKKLYAYFDEKKKREKLKIMLEKKWLKKDQFELILPKGESETHSYQFDISLLKVLIRNFTDVDKSSNYWDMKKIPLKNKKEMEKICKKNKFKTIVYVMLLVEKRNHYVHLGKEISEYELNTEWNQIVDILDHLDYRSEDDKKVIAELKELPLDNPDKFVNATVMAQIEALENISAKKYNTKEEFHVQSKQQEQVLEDYKNESTQKIEELRQQLTTMQASLTHSKIDIQSIFEKVDNIYLESTKLDTESLHEAIEHSIQQQRKSHDNNLRRMSVDILDIKKSSTEQLAILSQLHKSTHSLNHQVFRQRTAFSESTDVLDILIDDDPPDHFQLLIENTSKLVLRHNLKEDSLDIQIQKPKCSNDVTNIIKRVLDTNMDTLSHLDLDLCDLENNDVKYLADKIPYINTVILKRNARIDNRGWQLISSKFLEHKHSACLSTLDVSGNNGTNESFFYIAKMIPYITEISISNSTRIQEKAWLHLKKQIKDAKDNLKLRVLNIYGKPLVQSLRHVLSLIEYLYSIKLFTNEFNRNTLHHLLDQMKMLPQPWREYGTKIESIGFSNCTLGERDFKVLMSLLNVQKSITFRRSPAPIPRTSSEIQVDGPKRQRSNSMVPQHHASSKENLLIGDGKKSITLRSPAAIPRTSSEIQVNGPKRQRSNSMVPQYHTSSNENLLIDDGKKSITLRNPAAIPRTSSEIQVNHPKRQRSNSMTPQHHTSSKNNLLIGDPSASNESVCNEKYLKFDIKSETIQWKELVLEDIYTESMANTMTDLYQIFDIIKDSDTFERASYV